LASVGEAVKTEIPIQAAGNSNNNPQTGMTTSQPDSTVKPSSPEAVSPVVAVSGTDSSMSLSDVSGKNTPNNSTVLAANALLASNTNTPNQGHGSSVFSLGVAAPSNAGPTGSIDSAQVLNQILQQVAAQTADAKTISRLNFQLVPESLGKVTVQIALIDQSVSARLIVTNPEIKEVLQSHMVDLKAALNQAGLQIDQLQVQVQGGGGNLLAQYYQYQQEGSGYRLPTTFNPANGTGSQNDENAGNLASFSLRTSLVNVLA
jgi:flagellar hook-length control protein FliK